MSADGTAEYRIPSLTIDGPTFDAGTEVDVALRATIVGGEFPRLVVIDWRGPVPAGTDDRYRLACKALAAFVRDAFPHDHSLAAIAETGPPDFGGPITPEQIAALRELEAEL